MVPLPLEEAEEEAASECNYGAHAKDTLELAMRNTNTSEYHRESNGKERATRRGRGKGELLALHADTFRSNVPSRA